MDFMTDIVPKNFPGCFMSQKLSTSPQICPQNHGSKSQYCPRNCQQNCHKSILLETVNKIVTKLDNTFVNENMNAQNTYN